MPTESEGAHGRDLFRARSAVGGEEMMSCHLLSVVGRRKVFVSSQGAFRRRAEPEWTRSHLQRPPCRLSLSPRAQPEGWSARMLVVSQPIEADDLRS